jgi:hypothetical protein
MKKKVNLNDSYVTKMIVIRVIGLGVMILISILMNSCAVEDHNCRDWRMYHQSNGPIL